MSGKKLKVGVDNTYRRTWDKDEYKEKAAKRDEQEAKDEESALDLKKRRRLERDPLHQGLIVERAALQQRDFQLDLTSRLGKTQVVTTNTPLNQQAGYYCSVCDCILRDSQSYLDHINGKYHNRALGMSMRVEKSTADQVRKRFDLHKKRQLQSAPVDTVPDGFDRATLEREQAEQKQREASRSQAAGDDEEEEGIDPDMALMMGFAGFGSSKA
ncbi:hypothetical protein WJX72_011008 [[Myrmecia] bisecta]|uniref:U1-type domain-containing protein n=1 Tax=[Myrmecia] bisecta TaxID=41462 RepID=A0AAW1P4D0_9CHLO